MTANKIENYEMLELDTLLKKFHSKQKYSKHMEKIFSPQIIKKWFVHRLKGT